MRLSSISLALTRLGGAPFTPASLFTGGIAGAWYDPSDSTTLFSDRAGTTPCGTPGGGSVVPVGLMLDKSQGLQRFWSGYFDGTGDYLTAPSNAAFQYGTGNFTVEGWHYLTAVVGSTRYLFDQRISGTGVIPALYISGGSYVYYVNTSIPLTAGAVVANTWVHWAIVRNSGTTTLYINGSAVGSFADSNNYSPAAQFRIGSEWSASGLYDWQGYLSNVRAVKGVAVYTANFTPPSPVTGLTAISGTSLLTCQNSTFIDNSSNAFAIAVNGNTVTSQNIPLGNHAIAANDTTARPELRARVNLLTYSEQFDNAAWVKLGTTVTGNAATAPDGTNTADLAVINNGAQANVQLYNLVSGFSSISVTLSAYVKNSGANYAVISFIYSASIYAGASFDLTLATPSLSYSEAAGGFAITGTSIQAVSGAAGWYRISMTVTTPSIAAYSSAPSIIPKINAWTSGRPDGSDTGDGIKGILVWGADLRPANIGTTIPAYQRIADQYTYDAVGFPRYLAFNGTSSAMSTPANVNLSGTDKVTVFAGVRKVGTGTMLMVETSADSSSNNGSLSSYVVTPGTQYAYASKGTAPFVAATTGAAAYTAPVSNVLTGISDISGDSVILRLNGAQIATNTADQGSGNYGTYPLFIGSRNNSTFFFNGNIYGLTVVGSALSAGQITQMEQWVAGKTGITI